MALKGGHWGKILCVDLSSEETGVRTFDDDFARKYLGGVGLAARIIYENVTKDTNPLGPGNVLVFATGPYQATNIASSGRCAVAAKSPLTGYWGESSGGSKIGPELKRAGFDAVAITGKARKPVYLWVSDGKAEIRDGSEFWGLDTAQVTDALQRAVGSKKVAVSSIGPAGESLVRFACIANDKHGYFGRCGLGAVMGSKNLKALVVNGTLKPPIANPDKLNDIYKRVLKNVKETDFVKLFRKHGQASDVERCYVEGLLPLKNFGQGVWPEAEQLFCPRFTDELQAKAWACPYCVMGCHRRITNPEYKSETGGPEYETIGMIGSNLLVEDLGAIVRANDLCNLYGMDTIELGGVLGWAFECYEKGLITKEDTDGIELKWGSGEALVEMTEKIAKRDGIGNLLAEGLRAGVERIPGSKPYAVEVMGQSVAAHDPRAYFGQTVPTIASTRASCHIHGWSEAVELASPLIPELGINERLDRFDAAKKGYAGAIYQDVFQVWNSFIWCINYSGANVPLTDELNILNAITGWDVTPKEAQKIGERIVCLQHMFNLGMGLVPEKDNVMPERLTVPLKEGGTAGKVPPWQAILKEYWETKDWPNGIPTKNKLAELGLEGLESKKVLSFGAKDYRY